MVSYFLRRKISLDGAALGAAILLAAAAVGLLRPLMAQAPAGSPDELSIVVGKSAIVNSDQLIERVSVGFGDYVEAMAVTPREVLVNAKATGSTSLIVWQRGGGKLFFDVKVRPNPTAADNRLDALRRQLRAELPDQEITPSLENDSVFLRGTARDTTSVRRAVAIASTAGKVVNLLYVAVPSPEPQILLRVRFASVDRIKLAQAGANLFSTGSNGKMLGTSGTEQFPSAVLPQTTQAGTPVSPYVFNDLLNLFFFRRDIDLGGVIKALQANSVLEVLAEPNILAQNGKQGSFLAGGEYPYPVVQGSSFFQTVTIQFREFGVRLNVIPTITPNGTIRLQVAPEVSSLDYTNGVTLNGFVVPGLVSRKMKTEVELDDRQSFAIAGLLDRRVSDTFEKVPFIGDIPILGKFFRSKNTNRTNTELIVIVTPEIVQPIAPGAPLPSPKFPTPFMDSSPAENLANPVAAKGVTAAELRPAALPAAKTIPIEDLIQSQKPENPLDMNAVAVGSAGSGAAMPATTPVTSPAGGGPY